MSRRLPMTPAEQKISQMATDAISAGDKRPREEIVANLWHKNPAIYEQYKRETNLPAHRDAIAKVAADERNAEIVQKMGRQTGAERALEKQVAEYRAAHGCDEPTAYTEVLKTAEGAALYKRYRDESRPV